MEQCRRSAKFPASTEVLFDASMKVPMSQKKFLSNQKKNRFISMLSEKF